MVPSTAQQEQYGIVGVAKATVFMVDTTSTGPSGPRAALSLLARNAKGGLISAEDAARVLGVGRRVAVARLSRLLAAGWLARARRGLYLILPLEATGANATTVEDPWVLAEVLLSPCYIGGWSAAEHWGLTEQIFRSTFVATAAGARSKSRTLLGAELHIVRVSRRRITGGAYVWRGPLRVSVSDRERTIADALVNPDWVGGVRHLIEILTTYRRGPDWSPSKLLTRMKELGRGSAYKRLGFLAEEVLDAQPALVAKCARAKTSGVIKLDPAVASRGHLVKRWGLWANVGMAEKRDAG
jgi:predicted transcriptional regulator of viral defense system